MRDQPLTLLVSVSQRQRFVIFETGTDAFSGFASPDGCGQWQPKQFVNVQEDLNTECILSDF
jgi:hypothetical protein